MFAVNRRAERKEHVLKRVTEQFHVNRTIDLSNYEERDLFLEGTGSMVLDRENRIAYACLSPRTDTKVLSDFCARMNYEAVVFHATDGNRQPIYHTNVMMCVADKYVVICLESIPDPTERQLVYDTISRTNKKIIPISLHQVNDFAGNMLQVEDKDGEKLLVMSTRAYEALTSEQQRELGSYNRIVHASLNTIETNGGGSARCMMAEVHLPFSGPKQR